MNDEERPPDDPEPPRFASADLEGHADSKQTDITRLLDAAGGGDPRAAQKLLPLVYDQLRKAAQKQMAKERHDHTLQATALVHEAYIRLVGSHEVVWENRAHFYVAAAEAMRRVLIEHARKRGRIKRGGDRKRVPLSAVYLAEKAHPEEIMSVDTAIRRLEERDSRMARIVRLRFSAGLSVEDTAETLGLSDRTVRREWALARAWLHRELGEGR
jgi:RNA polymerase sigma factor (TIGR02999 family)